MEYLPFTTYKENEALADTESFRELIRDKCPQMETRDFFLSLDHCPCPQCNTPLIIVIWRPYKQGDPIDNVLERNQWISTPLPHNLPRELKVMANGEEKRVCINHEKGVR